MKNSTFKSNSSLRLKSQLVPRLQTKSGQLRGLYAQRAALLEQLAQLNVSIRKAEALAYQDLILFEEHLGRKI